MRFELPLVAMALSLCVPCPSGAVPQFHGLGESSRFAFDVSADGTTVVGRARSSSGINEAFSWTLAGGLVSLNPGASTASSAEAVSADGSVIVGDNFIWTASDGFQPFVGLAGAADVTEVRDISADGSLAVGSTTVPFAESEAFEAMTWSGGTLIGLGGLGFPPPDDENEEYGVSYASAVSADGSSVVGKSTSVGGGDAYGNTEAFLWTAGGGMLGLGDLTGGGFLSLATGISADGTTIVGHGTSAAGGEAFRWTAAEGMVGLGDLPGAEFSSSATDASADGSFIVGTGRVDCDTGPPCGRNAAFIWDENHGMRDLELVLAKHGVDLAGWSLDGAAAISDDGLTIAGYGFNPSGDLEAWIAVIPEPATGTLLMAGLIALCARGRASSRR